MTSPTPLLTPSTDRPSVATAVALITGGGRGIGRLLAQGLSATGTAVALVARSGDELDETVELVERAGGTAAAVPADVTDPTDLASAVADLRRRLGPVDLLINNAGVVGPIGPLWETDARDWWATLDVNLRGIVLTTGLVLPEMVAQRRGRIINMTSQAGAHRWPLVSAYSVSKAAVVKLSENLAHETARHGISVFSVHPGLLPIGMSEDIATRPPATAYEAHVRDWAMRELDAGRGADPEQAVALVVRLAAGDADALSGRHLSVHDDLDAVLARLPEVHAGDLYVLRPDRLRARARSARSLRRPAGPAYLRGRRADVWRAALAGR
jgi:NAD(P)-dependent dehydrogenase (short-subunit alcohol dehydrogenase family)